MNRCTVQHGRDQFFAMDLPKAEKPLVFACSGCSDTGEIADRAARWLNQAGIAQMSYLAGIGGRVKSALTEAQAARTVLIIDGCRMCCAKRTLELAGFKKFQHLGLDKLGLQKGASPVTEERIAASAVAAAKLIWKTQPLEPSVMI